MGRDVNDDPMLPDPPPPQVLRELGISAGETRTIGDDEVWWRVHRTEGEHVLAWNALRTFGPLLRFDPNLCPAANIANAVFGMALQAQMARSVKRFRSTGPSTATSAART